MWLELAGLPNWVIFISKLQTILSAIDRVQIYKVFLAVHILEISSNFAQGSTPAIAKYEVFPGFFLPVIYPPFTRTAQQPTLRR
jgi:hypothetical protein